MGVSELWSLLKAEGATVAWSGSNGGHAAIVQEVENIAVAIDLSTWIIQATLQPNLVEVFQDSECRALIVTFNRASPAHFHVCRSCCHCCLSKHCSSALQCYVFLLRKSTSLTCNALFISGQFLGRQ